uniref:Receptor kinase-like protein Xa21 n=1 Tax=Leersia perrieri TaxID=77586 RepID=A0A0D9XTC6_9ORYZ
MLLICHKRRRNKEVPATTSMQGHPMITYKQLLKATDGFSPKNLLGSGSFGSVYKGDLDSQGAESTSLVAVKVLKLETPKALKSFNAECEAIQNMRHRNLVKIVTISSSIDNRGNDFKAIVYDFMPNGSLDDWLHTQTNYQAEHRHLNLHQSVTILLDVACALDYLHCHGHEPVVHRDIKSSNVLLDADMVAHVGDFGLARILVEENSSMQQSTSSMGFRGTIGYAAPVAAVLISSLLLLCVCNGRTGGGDELALLSFKSSLLSSQGDSLLLSSWNTSTQHCTWPGVVCGGRRHPERVVALRLGSSNLSGIISPSIGNLSFLRELDLKDNYLSGKIPPELGRLRRLRWLDLSKNSLQGSIPAAIGVGMKMLEYLYLEENGLSGEIPGSLGELPSLQKLSLRKNSLSDSNKLSGEIPSTLGDCQLLQHLFLQNNILNGEIPIALTQLKGLDTLDLSCNNLSGQIPKSLGDMPLLHSLNLSFNSFCGEVPINGAFANVSEIHIQGNKNLCGGILDLCLPPCYLNSTKKKKHRILLLAVIICFVSTVAIISLFYMILIIHKQRRKKVLETTSVRGHPMITYKQLVEATDGFSSTNLLGSGSFGSVYKGQLDSQYGENTTLVAVKVLKLETPKALKSFTAECEALRNMRHRNLVKIVTICSSIDNKGNDFKAIVYDFMPNSSLEDWLHPATTDQAEQRHLNLHQRVTILLDVACALDYLHCHGPDPVVHCDIKSSNVLLDADMVSHVGDFGFARILVQGSSLLQQSTSSTGIRGTIGYAAPEYSVGNIASTHGDIYSYGILVLETVTGKRPTDGIFRPGLNIRQYVEPGLHGRVMDVVDMKLVSDSEDWVQTPNDSPCRKIFGCLVSLLRLGLSCSHELPSSRMPTGDIVNELNAIKQNLSRLYPVYGASTTHLALDLATIMARSLALLLVCSSMLLCPVNSNDAAAVPTADELTLLSFKSSMLSQGDSLLLSSWNTSGKHCTWPGVVCAGQRHPERVVALRLASFNLSGIISLSLCNLSFLRELNFSGNYLSGEIPSELSRLQGMIPREIGAGLKHLSYLNLRSNGLSGEIPSALGNLTNLQVLNLGYNRLSGAIPSSLGQLLSLSILSLGTNNWDMIPNSMWNLSSLKKFRVRENMLGGMIHPNAFNTLHLLEGIYIDTNHFHGKIPSSLANASRLSWLQISDNLFGGIFPLGVGRLRNLTGLLLDGNLFQSREPKDWLLSLDLGGNQFGGVLPDSFSNLSTSFSFLALGLNEITGSIPKDIGNLIGLQYLYLVNNSFTGFLPSSLGRLKNIGLLFAYDNNLSGSIPLTIGNLTELNYLLLDANNFSGWIPSTLSNLTKLLALGLSTNNLSGHPPAFFQCEQLAGVAAVRRCAPAAVSRRFPAATASQYGVGNIASTHGDIYSYGILVLETVTGKRPTDRIFRPGLSLH